MGEPGKQEKELSLGGFSVGGCRKQGRRRRRRSKMKGERRGVFIRVGFGK